MIERTYTAIFCEDIRKEVGNRISLLGSFTDTVKIPQKPLNAPDEVVSIIPKLCVYFRFQFDVQDQFQSLRFKVILPPHKEMSGSYDEDGFRDVRPEEIETAREVAKRKGLEIARLVSLTEMWPFPIFGPSQCKAEIIVDGQSHLCSVLRFTDE